ncbi:hypothetical protein FACS1894147_02420 [Spirochaetia bacterium]|nr:hypothetical protein FACS1894147_02420 [Spirochaetia bacterium]
MRRPYLAESAIEPGTGVVQGSAENKVTRPGDEGEGDFIGVYAFEANERKDLGDQIGVDISGVVKVLAGADVVAGKKAVLKADDSGKFIKLPTTAGTYATCGTFLQSGAAGEYVEMIVERGSVTIPAV